LVIFDLEKRCLEMVTVLRRSGTAASPGTAFAEG